MADFNRARKADLISVATELDIEVQSNFTVAKLRDLIKNSPHYEENFINSLIKNLIEERNEMLRQEEIAEKHRAGELELEKLKLEDKRRQEELENEKRKLEINFELEKLKLQNQNGPGSTTANQNLTSSFHETRTDIQKLLPTFNPESDDITLFLVLLERQLKLSKVPEVMWVSYLLSVVPSSISTLVARESEENALNFSYIKDLLLKRFKISAGKFRQLFFSHRKSKEITWRDFYFEIRAYFENWLSELKVDTFDALQELILSDQIKKRVSSECKEHLLDAWEDLNSPMDLVERLDSYDSLRPTSVKKDSSHNTTKKEQPKKEYVKKSFPHSTTPIKNEKSSIYCYGCGKPGVIKSKCYNCNPTEKSEKLLSHNIKILTCNTSDFPVPNIDITICKTKIRVCADTGANRSIAGELTYKLFHENGVQMNPTNITMKLADGKESTEEALTAKVPVDVEGRKIDIDFIVFPNLKGNRTLLGLDFLNKANIVLSLPNKKWYFLDNPRQKYMFGKELKFKTNDSIANIEVSEHDLREDEGKALTREQRGQLNALLKRNEDCFRLGGEPTPHVKHFINTGSHPPVASPPYRMSPQKKDLLKKEIEDLLAKDIIEECESPYASPVVLVPKPNGTVRLCIDYRKLNSVTTPDKYPLPRMDDLLHDAKSTTFMSTLDLKSGYHQIEVNPADQDKTTFVCSYGTFRYKRMPYGLRNAPATFQRLMDQFRNGLPNVDMLTYLDDMIVLSPTFEKHIEDLKAVFDRLKKFNLCANREKCKFACSRVKYLGLWITPRGIEVDQDKISAIQDILCPRNIKQLQSFLQTCSWYRKFIPNFSDIARPLSNLTRKNCIWKWSDQEQQAFLTLKECLITSPVLKQVDVTKPFIIRTDASSYALGAVLLQGDDKTTEHPIEYASRLLSAAERNYSTTEREALAVVWALEKFRGYVEGQEIIIVTDHQPLKWFLSLKSPSGRLARWALRLQSYNLKIDYIPGKSNVIADMLSRPVCDEISNCEEVCNFVSVDMPTRSSNDIREAQLNDENLKKIIDCFEDNHQDENFVNWTDRGYLMNQGILYRYAPDSDTEEAQLVIPSQEREDILKLHHDSPTAGHYGEEGTYHRIAQRYYWTGMRSYISNYVKNCPECCRFKASNQKPAGLLRTPAYAQRFETLSIDLFGPLPPDEAGHKWIFIVEDCATKWIELFPLISATARECATTLIEEVFFRYGIPRKLISDNGPQFVSAVLQQVCCSLKIDQILTPVYHPQANPVERKNRDLKPRLAILVGDAHDTWADKLPSIRFALNSSKSDTTGHTAAYLQFGRELRTIDDVAHDLRAVLDNDNFVPEITPYLKRMATTSKIVKERVEMKQDQRKEYYDKNRRKQYFSPGNKVWVMLHPVSKASQKKTSKFMPKRDGPYLILTQRSPVTYEIASLDDPTTPIGKYHVSALKPFQTVRTSPVAPLRKRGRPKTDVAVPSSGRGYGNRGGVCNEHNRNTYSFVK